MLLLGKDVINEITILDAVSQTEITVFYKSPTAQEQQAWSADLFRRENDEVVDNEVNACLKFGAELMVGVSDGALGIPTSNGEIKPISSDPKSPDYDEDWKRHLMEHATGFVVTFGNYVFRGHRIVPKSRRPGREKYTAKN